MQVSITGRHVELTEPLKSYVQDKLQHLKHSFDHVLDVHVVLSVEKFRQRCEVTIQANGVTIHARHETEDMYASIDGVVDKLNRQLKRYRQKLRKHHSNQQARNNGGIKVSKRTLTFADEQEELHADAQPATIAHTTVSAKPMSLDEAIMQLELSGEDELVFTNQETENLSVLYRKADGTFSCIEPEAS
ncbi:MAG: ribosome-associated translation inhibitor RaiA [Zetaproteobacteria bacterium]|nr:MAG: ribosome-associated translation inhibitor RaiA [Zetaproteobacteria bacterium]